MPMSNQYSLPFLFISPINLYPGSSASCFNVLCYSIVFVVFDLASIRYLCYVFTDILLFLNANMLLMLMPNRDEIGIVQLSANRLTYNSVRSFTSTLKVILLHLMEFLIE